MIDIVERLRELPDCHNLHGRVFRAVREAADEIEWLRKERDHYGSTADAREMLEAVERAEVEIERLRAALRSIVQCWDWWRDDPYNRCQSVPGDAIEEARALLTGAGR